jgi:hypothetical protein
LTLEPAGIKGSVIMAVDANADVPGIDPAIATYNPPPER